MSFLCRDLAQISIRDAFSLEDLPVEIVMTISDFCDTSSLVNLARSSKGFYKILESEKNDRARKEFLYPPEEGYKYEHLESQILQNNPWSNQPMPWMWMWMYKRTPGASLNDTGYLCRAIETGKVDGLKFLLDLGADPNWYTIHGTTLLIHAVQENQPKIVQLLLERGADVNAEIWDSTPAGDRVYRFNAFYWAQYLPDEDIVQLLLRTGQVHILRQDLQKLLLNRPLETLRVLFENLTPALLMKKKSYADWTLSLLHELMDREKSRGDAMSLALSFNLPKEIINARCSDGNTVIYKVLRQQDLWSTLIPTLITCGLDLSNDTFDADVLGPPPSYYGLTTIYGATALHVMIHFGKWDLANQLIKAGCQLNVIARSKGKRGSELHMAVRWNAPIDVISSLLTAGADVNCVHDLGSCRMPLEHPDLWLFQTPLSWAIQYEREATVRAILTLGIVRPDLTIKNWRDETPMEQARLSGNVEIIRMLEEELESQNRT
ncbi:hypothetical protein N7493_010184 [Penicillium malachiteum]|uniref:F-box domain-containing protein n=1 Tax=Penicillium malachiteum TaxID=1324776 RepID=A0AAD6HCK7_9EURO|nr:hypothetical protein N7493_010184 [Penicillium malachiteum]